MPGRAAGVQHLGGEPPARRPPGGQRARVHPGDEGARRRRTTVPSGGTGKRRPARATRPVCRSSNSLTRTRGEQGVVGRARSPWPARWRLSRLARSGRDTGQRAGGVAPGRAAAGRPSAQHEVVQVQKPPLRLGRAGQAPVGSPPRPRRADRPCRARAGHRRRSAPSPRLCRPDGGEVALARALGAGRGPAWPSGQSQPAVDLRQRLRVRPRPRRRRRAPWPRASAGPSGSCSEAPSCCVIRPRRPLGRRGRTPPPRSAARRSGCARPRRASPSGCAQALIQPPRLVLGDHEARRSRR